MAYSAAKCKTLAADITALELALTQVALGQNPTSIQDGPESVSFNQTSQSRIEARLDTLRRQYQRGSCAVTLGNDDIDPPQSRRALRPIIGHN